MDQLKSFFNGKKVLVTGHTGFKGAWLVQMLISWGADVSGLALPPETTPSLFTLLGLETQVRNHFEDVRDLEKVRTAVREHAPDIVFHLAAQALVRKSYNDPALTFSTNVAGTANVLEAVRETGHVRAVVVVTSDKVYTNRGDARAYREDDALGGGDPYSASKAAADIVAQSYIESFFHPEHFGHRHKTLVGIGRAGNVIGGGDWAPDRLIPDIVRAVHHQGGTVTVRNPEAVRPWQHVVEPLFGYLLLAKRLYEGDTRAAGAWNFGPDEGGALSVEEILKRSFDILGSGRYEVVPDSTKPEARTLTLDVGKAKKFLGWEPRLGIDDALWHTLLWYRNYYTNPDSIGDFTERQIRELLP